MRLSIVCFTLALLLGCNGGISAQDDDRKPSRPDLNKGATLAQRWCASCHVISSTQSRGSDAVPSFPSIAQREGFSAEKLAFFLLVPHPMMPNMSLTRDEARDIAAYIVEQRR